MSTRVLDQGVILDPDIERYLEIDRVREDREKEA